MLISVFVILFGAGCAPVPLEEQFESIKEYDKERLLQQYPVGTPREQILASERNLKPNSTWVPDQRPCDYFMKLMIDDLTKQGFSVSQADFYFRSAWPSLYGDYVFYDAEHKIIRAYRRYVD